MSFKISDQIYLQNITRHMFKSTIFITTTRAVELSNKFLIQKQLRCQHIWFRQRKWSNEFASSSFEEKKDRVWDRTTFQTTIFPHQNLEQLFWFTDDRIASSKCDIKANDQHSCSFICTENRYKKLDRNSRPKRIDNHTTNHPYHPKRK